MKPLPDTGYPQTGDKSEAGKYICMNCPHEDSDDESVAILDEPDILPECPVCGNTYWMKL